jgi:O-antigen/teichoic acid export membrane protein
MSVQVLVRGKLQAVRADPLLVNSTLLFATTMLMAGGGAAFWVVAARLQSAEVVGLAGSLVSAADALALFAQLGLNIALVRTLPISQRRAADVLTA